MLKSFQVRSQRGAGNLGTEGSSALFALPRDLSTFSRLKSGFEQTDTLLYASIIFEGQRRSSLIPLYLVHTIHPFL